MVARIKLSLKHPFTGLSLPSAASLGALPAFPGLRTLMWVGLGLLLVAVMYLAQFSRAAVLAHSLQNKEAQIQELERENAQLQFEIAVATSPASIEQRATKLGLGPAKSVVYANLPALDSGDAQLLPELPVTAVPALSQDLTVAVPSPWDQILALYGLDNTTNSAEAQSR